MPITFAHPVAAIPLRWPLARLGVLSALVIGSIVPDVPLFVPIGVSRGASHSLAGLFTFCLPVGILAYLLYDLLLEEPITALMPDGLQRRLAVVQRVARPVVLAPSVLISLLAGAATHVAWDSFTHGGAGVVQWLPAIEHRLFTISGYTVYVFNVLQHSSSVVGTVLMAVWIRRWYRQAPLDPSMATDTLPAVTRSRVLMTITTVVVVAVMLAAVSRFPEQLTLRALQPFARRVIVSGLSSLVVAVTCYAIVWRLTWRPAARGTA